MNDRRGGGSSVGAVVGQRGAGRGAGGGGERPRQGAVIPGGAMFDGSAQRAATNWRSRTS